MINVLETRFVEINARIPRKNNLLQHFDLQGDNPCAIARCYHHRILGIEHRIVSLRTFDLQPDYRSDVHTISTEFIEPCLTRSTKYQRAVGYFTSAGLAAAARGLKALISNGGSMQLVASPIFDQEDVEAIQRGERAQDDAIERALLKQLASDIGDADSDGLALLAWLVGEKSLEIKIAIPVNHLGKIKPNAIYHEKIGIFSDKDGNQVAFTGSPNETKGGLVQNFESLDIFWSWDDPHGRVQRKIDTFHRLWKNDTQSLMVRTISDAVRKQLITHRRTRSPDAVQDQDESHSFCDGLWSHQKSAIERFLREKSGVLEMATGTGKTRTALAICETLVDQGYIDTVIIAADGVDLLEQWAGDVLTLAIRASKPLTMYRHYDKEKEVSDFLVNPDAAVLLVTRNFLPLALKKLVPESQARTILIHDEVHALGSPSNRANLKGLSDCITYKLGLSATPEREYDQDGNDFIEEHIGPIFYKYSLESAIQDGVLAPFDYKALDYVPSEEDRERVRSVYRKAAARSRQGNPMSQAEIWTDISKVYKTSLEKLPAFESFLRENPDVLERCIIFVETKEFGERVLEIVHKHRADFHTYFSGEDERTLRRFAEGSLECLITCHRLSEGIDIHSLRNVVLFSSARAKLETIQRIGRCLRKDPADACKIARIVDFVRSDQPLDADGDYTPTDPARADWLKKLSSIRNEVPE